MRCKKLFLISLLRRPRALGPVFEEETQHLPRGVRSSGIGVGAGGAAPRPCVCGSMDFPVLKDCAPARVDVNRAGIGMSSGDLTMMHRLSRVHGSYRPRDDMIAVAGMHRGVAIAVKNDGWDRLPVSEIRQNVAGPQSIRQVTLPHSDERRRKIVGGSACEARMHADCRIKIGVSRAHYGGCSRSG